MKKLYLFMLLPIVLVLMGSSPSFAQTTVSGTIKGSDGTTLAGVNIVVKGTVAGTISNTNGEYNLKVNQATPFTLSFSFVGYKTQEIEVKDNSTKLDLTMEEQTLLGQEVVVAASRIEENILKSPVTVEQLNALTIRQTASPDFYDALANVKGVQVSSGSMNFTAVNTRGFATVANTRFVQWVDGMDTQAPLLNFPTGTIMGLGELDTETMELVPGAASALYGPNAFNGILVMNSKSPFKYQGLSAQVKFGTTDSDAGGSHPMSSYAIRFAHAFNDKFAFKVNFSYFKATDWLGSDYKTDRNNPQSTTDLSGTKNFDGLNLYGDETQINTGVPSIGFITRTGFREQDMLDNRDAKTVKGDAALHYRITDKIEAIYNYRYGGGSSIYQGTEKYALRDFNQQFHKLELRGDNFFVRAYQSATDPGKSYNLSALGAYANETYAPSAGAGWAQGYVLAMQGYIPGVAAGNPDAARAYADRDRPVAGTPQYTDLMNKVRANFFQKDPTGTYVDKNGNSHPVAGGAAFYDNSKLNHAEFNYKFFNQIKWAEIQVGGNLRQYNLFSNGTIFNEAPNDGVNFKRIKINEGGAYVQVAKTIADALKLTGSLRYDKNMNFDGHVTPRISAVYTVAENHNFRASFQTGFRNPDTQAQYIYFPASGATLLGSVKENAERYHVHNGGSYTQTSYSNFVNNGGQLDPTTGAVTSGDASLLVTANVPYVQPEKQKSFEIGYKGVIATKLLVDLNYYYTTYQGFIGTTIVASKTSSMHQGVQNDAGSYYSLYSNSTEDVKSYGVGLGLSYSLPSSFILSGNYNYAGYKATEGPDFRAGFNTPKNKFNIGLSNRKVTKNIGFNINYRWQEQFDWVSSYVGLNGYWTVPKYGVVDAQISYKVAPIKTVVKIGGTNIGGGDYRTNFGSPFIGQTYYVSLTFDQFFNN